MSITQKLLDRATKLIREGKKEDGRKVLSAVFQDDPENISAWIWYIEASEDDEERIKGLERLLKIQPKHFFAQKQLIFLLRKKCDSLSDTVQATSRTVLTTKRNSAPVLLFAGSLFVVCLLLAGLAFSTLKNNVLTKQIIQLSGENENLTQNYQKLETTHSILIANFEGLKVDYASISDAYQVLETDHETLMNNYQTLETQYNDLEQNFNELGITYYGLIDQYNLLNQDFYEFQAKAIIPPYIYIHNREVLLAFSKLDGTLMYWTLPFDSLEKNILRGEVERKLMWLGLLRLDNPFTNEKYMVVDNRLFVDTSSFQSVIPDLYYHADNEETFIREVWNIVAQLTAYSTEYQETPRFPLETLLSGGGDCEDHAILFASLLLAAPVNWRVSLVYMDGYNPTMPQTMNHVIVSVETSFRKYYIEATSNQIMEPYADGVYGWSFEIEH